MATIFDSYTDVRSGNIDLQYTYGTVLNCMLFGCTSGYEAESIALYLRKNGTPGTCTAEIFATDPNDDYKPTGSALATATFDADTDVATSFAWVELSLDAPVTLTRGTIYAIVVSAPNGTNIFSDSLTVASSFPDPYVYFNGNVFSSQNNGALWSTSDNRAIFFTISGTATSFLVPDIFSYYAMTTVHGASDTAWIAQVFTSERTGTISAIDLGLQLTSSDASTITVSIYPVDGNGEPDVSGSALGTATLSASSLQVRGANDRPVAWSTIDFATQVPITADTKYAVVIYTDGSLPKVSVRASHISVDSYEGEGHLYYVSTDGGGTWSAANTDIEDLAFKLYGFSSVSVTPVDVEYTKKLVAAGNNQIWYESTPGTMSELPAATDDIDCINLLNMFEGYGKVFVTNKENIKVADFQNSKITTADVVSGGVYPQFGAFLVGGTSGAAMSVDYITSLTGASIIYGVNITDETFASGETVTGTNPDGTSVSFVLDSSEVTGPHWYDWATYGNSTNFGAMPPRATLGCLFRGRAVISGNNLAPHQWYMSRQANPFDWLYGINDAQSAVAGNNTDAGEVGDVITALIPYKDDFLVFGCVDSIWYLTGDPASGGSLDELDLTTGIFGANSWCWGENDVLYFWGLNGIYSVSLPGGTPKCLSEIRLPKLIDDEAASPTTHRITMVYDKRRAGLLTTITKLSDGSNSCYWYDFRTEGFFPETYPNSSGVFSAVQYNAFDTEYKQVMYGTYDGYIRYHDEAIKDDDTAGSTEAIESYVTFGPFLMAKWAGDEGKITGFDLILGGGGSSPQSDGADYEFYTGKSAEEVLKKMEAGTPIAAAGTESGSGRSRKTFRRKVRGVYCGIKVKNISLAQTWAMEQAIIEIAKGGRLR